MLAILILILILKEVQPTIAANKKPSAGTNRGGGERLKILDQISNNDPSNILEQ